MTRPDATGLHRKSGASHDILDGIELAKETFSQWRKIGVITALAAGITYSALSFIEPTFTARASFISPQQQNSAVASLASLGALSALAGAGSAIRSPVDQYVALLQSTTIRNQIIDQFKLIDIYESKFREDALKTLAGNVIVGAGKKDGIITVEVDDHSPLRAAEMANAYVDELRKMTNTLAMSEAQQRRAFFEGQLASTQTALTNAQATLQQSGFDEGALRSEPKTTAELYSKTKAEAAATEIRLQALLQSRAANSPEILQLREVLSAYRSQLNRMEMPDKGQSKAGYATAYRDFKYYETLFEIYARQLEAAKLDEAREGALIQVVDPATPPERKSGPKRAQITLSVAFAALILSALFIATRRTLRGKA